MRRFLAAFASVLALAGAARAGDVTYPQLNNQTTVLDTDLLAIWRNPGPLNHLNASVFSQYVVNGLGKSTFLQTSNALSELSSVQATARTNLGLGSAAQAATGASGNVLCFLNTNCTVSGAWTFGAKINLTPGATPGTLANGDVWETASGVFGRVNGTTHQFAYLDSSITGNAATATNANAVGGVALSGLVQNNGGTYGINISGTASNANTVGGVGVGSLVQNNGGTYSINITGNANSANSAGSASTANALSGLNSNLSTNGYVQIPSSGGTLYIEWGLYDTGCGTCWNTASAIFLNFPITFPHAALNVVATTYNPAGIGSPRIATVYGPSSTGFFLVGNGGNSPEGAYWMAIGY